MGRFGRLQRKIPVAVALTLAFCLHAFAQAGFEDVPENYWGTGYIQAAAEAGIIKGYPTGREGVFKFEPEKSVSKQESLVMLYRMLEGAGILEIEPDADELPTLYEKQLKEAGIAAWAHPEVAYAFRRQIAIAEDFRPAAGSAAAPRQIVAVWASKAMNYELAPVQILPYADGQSISDEAFAHAEALYRNGIMTGDNKNLLNPKDGIRRVEFAAVCTRLLAQAGTMADSPRPARKLADNLILQSGIVRNVSQGGLRFSFDTGNGPVRSVSLLPDASIVIDGKQAAASDISKLDGRFISISCLLGSGRQVLIETGVRVQKGRVEALSSEGDYGILTLSTEQGLRIRYCYDEETLSDATLKTGASISLIADGTYVLEIQ